MNQKVHKKKIHKYTAQALILHGRGSTLLFSRLSLSASFPYPLQPHFRPQLKFTLCPLLHPPIPPQLSLPPFRPLMRQPNQSAQSLRQLLLRIHFFTLQRVQEVWLLMCLVRRMLIIFMIWWPFWFLPSVHICKMSCNTQLQREREPH